MVPQNMPMFTQVQILLKMLLKLRANSKKSLVNSKVVLILAKAFRNRPLV